jgi:hypothetical protein|tara:strand:+ start:2030 stop:2248 length:219 start_codon:yes stop_codon:yes gene_type:complete
MINMLKKARLTIRNTEKYLSSILAYEWMAYHPHFHGNDKRAIKELVNNLVATNKEIGDVVKKLKKELDSEDF